jgi:glycosyltransferase involved in cell wall biosynthesis
LNYALDENHPLLSHQIKLVNALSPQFINITVITSQVSKKILLPNNVQVLNVNWKNKQNFRNAIRFYKLTLPVLFRKRNAVVFSHMTETYSLLIGPFTTLLKLKHILWYAHKSKSWKLRLAYPFISIILTSTAGSCPIKSKKVFCIGQGIQTEIFSPKQPPHELTHFVHVGRFDKSKRIDVLIDALVEMRKSNPQLTLELIGETADKESIIWAEKVRIGNQENLDKGWLKFSGNIPRERLPRILHKKDIFIHAFIGSLDKTLIEATLTKLPVLTENIEYIKTLSP